MPFPALIFVTGKGGVGKTTVTRLLAQRSQQSGTRTAVVEVNGESQLAHSFGLDGATFGPTPVHDGLHLFSLDAISCLHDFGAQKLGSKRLVKLLLSHSTVQTLIDGVPGFHDLFQLGKINHLVDEQANNDAYERVFVDLPATGHALTFLSAASSIRDMVRVGPIHDEAKTIAATLTDPRCSATVVVALPQPLSILETLSFAKQRDDEHPSLGAILINRWMSGQSLSDPEWATVKKGIQEQGLPEWERVSANAQRSLWAQERCLHQLTSQLNPPVTVFTLNEAISGQDAASLQERTP
jgi:anion-transporting  ArsA/GET3 family ATPase